MADTRIEAGELNQRLTLQHDTGTETDSAGQHVPEWENWSATPTRWAGLRQLSVRESERAAVLAVEATHLITLRYDAGITEEMRGVIGGRVFYFGGVNNVEMRNIKLEILAAERRV